MLDQFRTLLWLRFIILRHTLTGGKALSLVLLVLVACLAFLLAAGIGVGLFIFAWGIKTGSTYVVLFSADGAIIVFLFFWAFALLMELQRSELIDFRKMLFLPVSLRMVFLLNYGVALFTPALILFVLPALGLILGLVMSFGPRMLLGLPLAAVFYLMLGSWTYYVRGIMAALMENKRRRRLVIVAITFAFVLIGQAPNLIGQAFRTHEKTVRNIGQAIPQVPEQINQGEGTPSARLMNASQVIHAIIPLAWLPYGIYSTAEKRYLSAAACFLGMGLLTALGLALGFRSTRRYYTGTNIKAPPRKHVAVEIKRTPMTARTLPIVDDDTAAMTMTCLLSYLRHPSMYMMFLMPLVMGVIFLLMLARGHTSPGGAPPGEWMLALVIVWPFLSFGMLIFNVFGTDRSGFRALILLPTERRKYLLAKHLALFPFVSLTSILFVILSSLLLHLGILTLLMALMQVLQIYLVFCAAGSFLSVLMPYRIAWEGMRGPGKFSEMNAVGFLLLPLTGILCLPALVCLYLDRILDFFGYPTLLPIGFAASVLMTIIAILIYRMSLRRAGALLLHREQRILEKLVRDRE